MNAVSSIRDVFSFPRFWRVVGIIAAVQILLMVVTTPMYEIDTNSFIRGGLTWDVYHNPFLNIFIGVFSKIWSNLYFLVGLQILFYGFAAGFAAIVLLGHKGRWLWAATAVATLEPLTMYYNFSLIAESFYTSFTLLAVALLVLWLRQPGWRTALAFGGAMGFTFLCKLSAMVHLPLFVLFLFRWKVPLRHRLAGMAIAAVPFMACYIFVAQGQKIINGGALYTVEGRVRWDFSSSQYDPAAVESDVFHRFVDGYILDAQGNLEPHRERRRELSYLGYKDCVAHYESLPGSDEVQAIQVCDSVFGHVAAQIMEGNFWEVEKQFISDNFTFIHSLNYIDYRFTPDLHFYYSQSEFAYIDSLMATHFGVDLSTRAHRIPIIWRSLKFGNVYMPIMFWLWVLAVLAAGILWLKDRLRWEMLVLGGLLAIPLVFHLVYISYRPRFLAPYMVLMLFLVLILAEMGLRSFKKAE